jgi:hypothetical protein
LSPDAIKSFVEVFKEIVKLLQKPPREMTEEFKQCAAESAAKCKASKNECAYRIIAKDCYHMQQFLADAETDDMILAAIKETFMGKNRTMMGLSDNEEIRYHTIYGKSEGQSFDFDEGKIVGIEMFGGALLDRIRLYYKGKAYEEHGGRGGTSCGYLNLEDDSIVEVVIRYGLTVDGLTVITEKGNRKFCGGNGGDEKHFKVSKNDKVVGFYGFSGEYCQTIFRPWSCVQGIMSLGIKTVARR